MNENKRKRTCLFGLPIDITTKEEVKASLLSSQTPQQVITINPEMITKSYKNAALSKLIKTADWIIPDGIGIVIALKILGINTKRIPGIELAFECLKEAEKRGLKVALVGADEETINRAKKELLQTLPNLRIVYSHNGYFNESEEKEILSELKNAEPEILLAGLGFPKQEIFLQNFKKIAKSSIMIGVGGSFDVWSKKLKRAPQIFQKLGLEWFYRLLCQPSRLKRMFPTIPLFLLKIPLEHKLHRREY